MSAKAQPCCCIKHLINLLIHQAKSLDLWTECVSVCISPAHAYELLDLFASICIHSVQHFGCSFTFIYE